MTKPAFTFIPLEDNFGDFLDVQVDGSSVLAFRFRVSTPDCPYICLDKEATQQLKAIIDKRLEEIENQ